jgi:hypothetical protein
MYKIALFSDARTRVTGGTENPEYIWEADYSILPCAMCDACSFSRRQGNGTERLLQAGRSIAQDLM